MKHIYLVVGTVDRALKCVEFFPTYEEAAAYINNTLLEASAQYDNNLAIMQDLRIKAGEPQDDDAECHLIDIRDHDMEAWHNHYDLDFYITEVSGKLAIQLSQP